MEKFSVYEQHEIINIFNDALKNTLDIIVSRGFPIRYGICTNAAIFMAEEINRHELPVYVVLGTVKEIEHAWIEDDVGNIYDPTVDMFDTVPKNNEYVKRFSFKTEPLETVWRFSDDVSPLDDCDKCGQNNVIYGYSNDTHDVFVCTECTTCRIQYKKIIPSSKWNDMAYVNDLVSHYNKFYPHVKFEVL